MFKVVGTGDDVTVCECCGKKNLKMTVALENEGGAVVRYGRDCAASALLGSKKGAKNVERLARAVDFARRRVSDLGEQEVHRRVSACGWANYWKGWVWNDAGRVKIDQA